LISADLIVIGAGASGVFAALAAKQIFPEKKILILEKTTKALSKVKISGGGRCNVTHDWHRVDQLSNFYPRGYKELRNVFSVFSSEDTILWFQNRDVKLKIEDDGRMFPITNSSQTIIDCLLNECRKLDVRINYSADIREIELINGIFNISTQEINQYTCKKIILAIGGLNTTRGIQLVKSLQLESKETVPSLFSFNLPNSPLAGLVGLSVENCEIQIKELKLSVTGPMIITHWGISGPAVLKLSSFAAVELYHQNYKFKISVNFFPEFNEYQFFTFLQQTLKSNSKIKFYNLKFKSIPTRLFQRIFTISEISESKNCADLNKSEIQKIFDLFTNFTIECSGKTTYKEEFVTAGGIDLKKINMKNMEYKTIPGLFVVGEMINVDGITGGFNFQNAWSTGYIAGINSFANENS
jgi:predicted Rossmann fold flavoprotein